MTDSMLQSALRAGKRGWSVLPLRPRGKAPLIPWQERQATPAGEARIRQWFERWPRANLGVVTGDVSGLVALDIDPRHGGDESLAALEADHCALPETVEAITGGGGRHLYFAHPGGSVPNRVAFRNGLDIRGDGGYIVMPPSVHPSGHTYRWRDGHSPRELEPAALPGWLADLISRRGSSRGHSLNHWRELTARGVEQGERNKTIASLAGHLLWHEVDPYVVMELLVAWNRERCRPPLSDREVARTVASITKLHERRNE